MNDLTEEARQRVLRAFGQADAKDADPIDQAIDMLAAIGIVRVAYRLDGGGDEGSVYLEEVAYADGRVEEKLPPVPLGFTNSGEVLTVGDLLESHAQDAPDFDWINNDGGAGSVTYHANAEDSDSGERVDVDVHPHEYDETDEDEAEEFDLDGDGDDDEDGDTMVIGGKE